MINKMKKTIEKFNLIDNGDCVVVGLSGGPDSTAMIYALNELKSEYNIKIVAVHLNHQIRGILADEDQKYVDNLCKSLGIEIFSYSEDIPLLSKELKMTEEEAGRKRRYELFETVCNQVNCQKIAIAQNKNDQVETFLMRMLRGASLDGLASIRYIRGNLYIRPILACNRKSIEDYCDKYDLNPRIDHTNLETDYLRNKIRLELMPLLMEKYNKNLIDTIYRNVDLIQRDVDYLDGVTDELLKSLGDNDISIDKLNRIHPSIVSRYLRRLIEIHSGNIKNVSSSQIEKLMKIINVNETGKKVVIKEFEWIIETGKIKIVSSNIIKVNEFFKALKIGKTNLIVGNVSYEIILEIIEGNNYKKDNKFVAYIDYNYIEGDIVVRSRKEGDRFHPIGLKGKSKKLKDFMNDLKIAKRLRDSILIFENSNEIIWVSGYRLDDKYKVNKDTKKMIKITLSKL